MILTRENLSGLGDIPGEDMPVPAGEDWRVWLAFIGVLYIIAVTPKTISLLRGK